MNLHCADDEENDSRPATDDPARPILDFVSKLLAEPPSETWSPEACLTELARVSQSLSAGFAGVIGKTVALRYCSESVAFEPWPWDEWPALLTALPTMAVGQGRQFPDGRYCYCFSLPLGDGAAWLLWLESRSDRSFLAGECAALSLAAVVLARFVVKHPLGVSWESWLAQSHRKQRLEDAGRVVDRIAHDFNNVLAGILGFAELSLRQMPENSPGRPLLNEVHEAAIQGSRLVKQLGLFSRRSKMSSQPFRLVDLIGRVRTRLARDPENKVALDVDIPERLPWMAIDGDSLQIILDHLLDNAAEAMAAGGTVKLSAREINLAAADCLSLLGTCAPGRHVEMLISDGGSGFSAEAREQVLAQPFFTTKLRHRGLGLATTYGLLTAVGGGIRLENENPSGTRVYCVVPVSPGPVSSLPSRSASSSVPRGAPRAERVLVVDDDPMTLGFMCTTLEQAGYQVHPASDGMAALDSFNTAKEPFRLLLSDVRMPRMTGFELAQQLLDRNPSLTILFTSGHVPMECVPEPLAGRHYNFLPKPFRSECLLTAVRSALAGEPTL